MRKAERLFQIITLLRGRRTVLTAATMAELLEVSERTCLIQEQRHSSPHCKIFSRGKDA
jgi:hypothetical protein